jgi:hypothetical protein
MGSHIGRSFRFCLPFSASVRFSGAVPHDGTEWASIDGGLHACTATVALNLLATVSLCVWPATRKPPVPMIVRLQEDPSETEMAVSNTYHLHPLTLLQTEFDGSRDCQSVLVDLLCGKDRMSLRATASETNLYKKKCFGHHSKQNTQHPQKQTQERTQTSQTVKTATRTASSRRTYTRPQRSQRPCGPSKKT